jgi:hypothetical protein
MDFPQKKKRGNEKKKMWNGDFACVGTVLGFINYQGN